eukprot:8947737-Lingulodinium_polyedra.AAC.1
MSHARTMVVAHAHVLLRATTTNDCVLHAYYYVPLGTTTRYYTLLHIATRYDTPLRVTTRTYA